MISCEVKGVGGATHFLGGVATWLRAEYNITSSYMLILRFCIYLDFLRGQGGGGETSFFGGVATWLRADFLSPSSGSNETLPALWESASIKVLNIDLGFSEVMQGVYFYQCLIVCTLLLISAFHGPCIG